MASTDERTLMLDAESDYDIRCQQFRKENAVFLGVFGRWLNKGCPWGGDDQKPLRAPSNSSRPMPKTCCCQPSLLPP